MPLKYLHNLIRKQKCLLPCSARIAEVAAVIIVAAIIFQACQEDFSEPTYIDRETLIAEGRYLTARSGDALTIGDNIPEPQPFEVGTPFRLLAFSKPYKTDNAETKATTLRFNTVTREDSITGGVHYMTIDKDPYRPDEWFGFSPLNEREKSNDAIDGLVALDFYGFTYGVPATLSTDYIKLDDAATTVSDTEEPAPADNSTEALHALKRTETVVNNELKDLMRGELLNRNIMNAGTSEVKDDNGTDHTITNPYTQSIIQFRHCFSKLRFQISQQGEDKGEKDANGNNVFTPVFGEDLYLDGIEVTNTYGEGAVYLHDGKVEIKGNPIARQLKFDDGFSGKITVTDTGVGEMIVFPSDGSSLTNMPSDMGDGYNIGLKITVRSKDKNLIKKFLGNTQTPETAETFGTKQITNEEGTTETWYWGTIIKDQITDYYPTTATTDDSGTTGVTKKAVKFKQNNSYMLIITFQKDDVRIITVIPQVMEWLPGEKTTDNEGNVEYWQDQEIGQPQMFDNIVWSDRNLGADAYDPKNDFEKTIGYFYQAGRNIPYFPFAFNNYIDHRPSWNELKRNQDFANKETKWDNNNFRFFPVVDEEIANIGSSKWWVITNNATNPSDNKDPQMYIPEKKPTDRYFDFMVDKSLGENDMHWEQGQSHQPVKGSWIIPTSKDYMSIFPTTPHAGNITFRKGGDNKSPMAWGKNENDPITATKTLRVTVPFYIAGSEEKQKPTDKGEKYAAAWETLFRNNDAGTTHTDLYSLGGPGGMNIKYEPNGDPEDGYASIYVLSMEDGHTQKLTEGKMKNQIIREWGTIYGIKRVYTEEAYRMRWRALIAMEGQYSPGIYIEICRYRCTSKDTFDEETYNTKYDWDHPAARILFPVCGLGDYPGQYINFGTECQYATSDTIKHTDSEGNEFIDKYGERYLKTAKTSAVQIKITGDNACNAYIAVIKDQIDRHFGMQIRPIAKTSLK